MPVNSTHADYDAALPEWIRGRDLLAGEDAVKAAGAKYLPRLDGQSNEDYLAYQTRACFSNATRRAADAFVGLVFRKAPFVSIPPGSVGPQRPLSTLPSPETPRLSPAVRPGGAGWLLALCSIGTP
jgi:hypothetical protein